MPTRVLPVTVLPLRITMAAKFHNDSPTSCSPLSFHNSLLDPCTGVTCGTGLTATSTLGVCQCLCGTSLCDLSISNTCDNGICKCGGDTSCDSTSNNPSCLTSSSATPGWGDSTATCKVNFVNNFLRMINAVALNLLDLYILFHFSLTVWPGFRLHSIFNPEWGMLWGSMYMWSDWCRMRRNDPTLWKNGYHRYPSYSCGWNNKC